MNYRWYVIDLTDEDGKRHTVEIATVFPLTVEPQAKTIAAFRVRERYGIDTRLIHSITEKAA